MGQASDPLQPDLDDEETDSCDLDFTQGEQTSDEDLPVAFGGEA